MKVELLRYTPDPERLCAVAARTTFKHQPASEIFEKMDLEEARKILRRVLRHHHYSVIEHATFTFSIEDVSRALTHQLVRHRMASYSQQSQRYVEYNVTDSYVVPDSVLKNAESKKIYEDTLATILDAYKKLMKCGASKEDARLLLSSSVKTNILVTMNARGLRHFFNLRCCERSQWEIRELAMEMLRQVRRIAPSIFENAGPSCLELGYCPERELKPSKCNIAEIKRRFAKL